MSEEEKLTNDEFHKKFAVDLFNNVWGLLGNKERTEDETFEMIHIAHASLFHWTKVGNAENIYVGEWQISRVYSVLEMPESALFHAKRSLDLCEKHNLSVFCFAYAYEALARAYSIIGDADESRKYLKLAREETERVKNEDEKKMLLDDFKTID